MSRTQISYLFLLFSVPFNIIVLKSGANLYLSTLVIFIVYSFLLPTIIKEKFHLYVIGTFFYLLAITLIFLIFPSNLDSKIVAIEVVKYFQLLSVLSISYYISKYVKFKYMMNVFLFIMFIASIRYIVENIHTIFLFSTIRGERPSPDFIGSFNNFAMLIGITILITIYSIKNILYKNILLIYWFIILITTLSRGTIVSLIVTFIFFLVMKKSLKYYLKVTIYTLFSLLFIVYILNYLGYLDIITSLLESRYLSFLGNDVTIDSYGSGRVQILNDIFYNHFLKSNIFQLLFGHGFGSIHFSLNSNFIYDTTHNNMIDILYKNGLFFFLFLVIYFYLILKKLLQYRYNRDIQLLLAIFIYYNFSILMNPILFAIQVNWIYTLFLGITIYTIQKGKK